MEQEQSKKCFCARCFLPIEAEDKVDIEGQNFHRICSMCCVCRTIPTSIKMFYGHVFCNECFKAHVLGRFRGETPRMQSSSWWTQWTPGMKSAEAASEDGAKDESKTPDDNESTKKYICSRCLQCVHGKDKVDIDGQHFHPQCARCYFCHTVPKSNIKIYYGQVFCEECFHRHVMSRNKDNPSEFFRTCFEQFHNPQFVEHMKSFMGGSKDGAPFVFCRCTNAGEWTQPDTRKSATLGNVSIPESFGTGDLSYEYRTDCSELPDCCHVRDDQDCVAAEKIEKLTKYLHELQTTKTEKKWKNFVEFGQNFGEFDKISLASYGWVDLQETPMATSLKCPKCLWQCGPIYVNSELLQEVCGALQ